LTIKDTDSLQDETWSLSRPIEFPKMVEKFEDTK